MTDSTCDTDSVPSLLAAYHRDPLRYHELIDAHGNLRAPWQRMLAGIERSDPAQMHARHDFVARARSTRKMASPTIVYADAMGTDRRWELDLLPEIIDAQVWLQLDAGIAQRAAVLDAVLADLYGAQTLLAEGLLPAELIYGHDNFLWPCQGLQPPGGTFLHIYAADLARAPDGAWWVVADRTQAPSGAGLCGREPSHHLTRISRPVPRNARAGSVRFYPRLADELAATRADRRGRGAIVCAAHARPLQRNLF